MKLSGYCMQRADIAALILILLLSYLPGIALVAMLVSISRFLLYGLTEREGIGAVRTAMWGVSVSLFHNFLILLAYGILSVGLMDGVGLWWKSQCSHAPESICI